MDVRPQWGDEDNLILRGSKTSHINKTARIMTLSCKNERLKLRVLNEVTTDGEYQMKFKKFDNNHLDNINHLENILDIIFENFDDDDRLEHILTNTFNTQNKESFEDKLNLLTRINDNLCPILRSAGKFEVSKEDLVRQVRKSIYEQNLDITTDWELDTGVVILRGSKRLDGAPLLSSKNRAWTLNVLEETTNAGEYQMKFERRPDLMTDVERLLFPLLDVKKLESFQDFLLRKVCELICERKINVYPEWGLEDTLILRGSKTSELTEIIRIRGLSCKFVYWKLRVLEDTTEDGEYQMKFKNVFDDSKRSITENLKKADEGEILMASISLPEKLESFQRSLVRDVCGLICDNEWNISPEWDRTADALILRRSKELDASKVPIGELACDNSYWKFNLLDETTQDGEFQMKFEKTARYDELMQHSCHRDFPMPRMSLVSLPFRPLRARFSTGSHALHPVSETISQDTIKADENEKKSEPSPELGSQEIPKDIANPTSTVETLLSPILGVEGLGTTQQDLLREVCESICEKKLDISPEWGVEDKDKLILRGSKTPDAAKISQIKGLTCENYAWRLQVLEDMTEADEYQMIFQPISTSEDLFGFSAVSVSQGSLKSTLLSGEKFDVDKSMSAGRRYRYHTQLRAQLVPEWMNDQLHGRRRFESSQGDLLRKLCESIHDHNLDVTPECHDIDTFILRGSEKLDITEMSRMLNLPRENNFWKLRVLEDTTEAGEYQVKFERNVEYQQGTDSMSAVDKLLSPILLAKEFGSLKRGLLRKLCRSIIEREWRITPEWHYTNKLILRGSKELDVTRNVIEDLSCKDDYFILKVLPYTTKGGEYQMNFEEIIKDDDEEISEIIQDMSKVNNLLSHIQSRKSFPTALLDVFRALCVSICAKEVPITPEWDETTNTLILRGSEKLHITPSVDGDFYSLDVVPSSVTEAGEYRMKFKENLNSFNPLRLFPVHSKARASRTICRWIEDEETLTNADVMSDANSLLSGIQYANDFLPAQVDILRCLCISICKMRLDIVPDWDATTDSLVLRGSANMDTFPPSYLGVGWSLFALPGYFTETSEYRMKFSQEV